MKRNKIKAPKYTHSAPESARGCFKDSSSPNEWYSPVMIGSGTVGKLASNTNCVNRVVAILKKLDPDDYVRYLLAYYEAGISRFGNEWVYADITTVLMAASEILRPENYLEIGVRRGRSMAMVAATCPECQIVGFDWWQENYAGITNPGASFVEDQLRKSGHIGSLKLISGNSHETVPQYLREYPGEHFDLITVDGDHSYSGAAQDLIDVLPRLKKGGIVVFDDICHPSHTYLFDVWRHLVQDDKRFSTWEYDELGYGVALAVRKW